jgi:CheY-like chemotaxis protein
VVDDDEAIRESVRWVLEDAGCVVDEAADGRHALNHLHASRKPLVVLVDWKMPGMDGHRLLEVVAADEALAERHAFILMTANDKTLPLAVANLLVRLHVPVVGKPFDLDALVATVEEAGRRLT